MKRRDFIETLAFAGAGALLFPFDSLARAAPLCLVGGSGAGDDTKYGIFTRVQSQPGEALFCWIGTDKRLRLPLPFKPHAFFQSPVQSHRFAVTEKWGSHLAFIDAQSSQTHCVVDDASRRFFGHGTYSADGTVVFVTQFDDVKKRGLIGIFDAKDGKRLGEYDSGGDYPHDCQSDRQGRILVMNINPLRLPERQNCLNWIDSKSGKLLKSTPFHLEDSKELLHFQQSEDQWIISSGLTTREHPELSAGCAAALSPSGEIIPLHLTDAQSGFLRGESLSIALRPDSAIAAVTSPVSNSVVLWDYKTGTVEKIVSIKDVRGIAYEKNQNRYYASMATDQTLVWLGAKTGDASSVHLPGIPWGNGSHIGCFKFLSI